MDKPPPELVAALERDLGLAGKRTADVPDLAGFRFKFRRRFYRMAEVGFCLTIFNFILSTAPDYALWPLSTVATAFAAWTMFYSEGAARDITRQLHRPAAEQLVRDMIMARSIKQ